MPTSQRAPIELFLCGDVMTGRGVDQILRHPGDPTLFEGWIRDARDYVALAEAANGPVPRRVDPSYPWGDARAVLARADARIINLETSITTNGEPWPEKEVHYRMHPANVDCLGAAHVDVCVLANNHVLDWGREGLRETLSTLDRAGLARAGAGRDLDEAERPASIAAARARVSVFAFGDASSGIPWSWAARPGVSGVALLRDLDDATADAIGAKVGQAKRAGELVVASIHWGGNWGYDVPPSHVRFAHRLVDAGVDVVHGHSSHHPRPFEIYRDRLVMYGCGELLDDYEGIGGHEAFRGELVVAWLPRLDPETGALVSLSLAPFRIRKLRLEHASEPDSAWLAATLDRIGRPYGVRVALGEDGLRGHRS